ARKLPTVDGGGLLWSGRLWCRVGARDFDGEPRASARRGNEIDTMMQHASDALHDGQAETETAGDLGAFVESGEFDEHGLLLRIRDAHAGVENVDPKLAALASTSNQHTACRRVLDRVGHEVLQQPPQQPAVGTNDLRAGHEAEFEALLAGERAEFDFEL